MRDATVSLDLIARDDELVVSAATEESDLSAIRTYTTHSWRPHDVMSLSKQLSALVSQANHSGGLTTAQTGELRRLGALLFDQVLPQPVKTLLRETGGGTLKLGLTAPLLTVPWELLHDGRQHLALRWGIGRVVMTDAEAPRVFSRTLGSPRRMLMIVDPQGDLPEAYNEGVTLKAQLDQLQGLEISFMSTRVDRRQVLESIRDFDLVHFAGHVEPNGLRLCDGLLDVTEIERIYGGLPMPSLVFLNGCGATGSVAFGSSRCFVNALLRSGVRHCIAALYELPDHLGRDLSLAFYGELASGAPVGDALRIARVFLAETHGVGSAMWAPYALYGDPSCQYALEPAADAEAHQKVEFDTSAPWLATQGPSGEPAPSERPQLRSQVAEGTLSGRSRSLQQALVQAFCIALLPLVAILAFLLWHDRPPTSHLTGLHLTEPTPAIVAGEDQADQHRRLRFDVLAERPDAHGRTTSREVRGGDVLHDDDRLSIHVSIRKAAFVYVLRVANNRVQLLEPADPDLSETLLAGEHRVPQTGFIDVTTGAELNTLVVATRDEEWPGPSATIAYLNDLLSLEPTPASSATASPLDRYWANERSTQLVVDYLERHDARTETLTYENR